MSGTPGGDGVHGTADRRVRTIVIVGGGTAGWMSAAALRFTIRTDACRIVLIESEDIGIVGVGESTLPTMRGFNRQLGIDENEFVSKTQATFKLGIEFVDWTRLGDVYFNPLSSQGFSSEAEGTAARLPSMYQYLLKLAAQGEKPDLGEYALCSVAARNHRFNRPANIPDAQYAYAYQFDASLYAKYLRNYAEKRGVERIEGRIVDVVLRGENGFVDSVVLQSGQRIEGDLFIDCSGFRALLIGQALKVPYEDWTHWLPCDGAWALPSESVVPLTPYTRATAREAGWQWRIPLQHRVGNGHVFSSKFVSKEKAVEALLSRLDGAPLAEPRLVRFTAGRRKQAWAKNCVAIGLSSGFVEPLESTSIQFIQAYIVNLIRQFPDRDCDPLLSDDYNRRVAAGLEAVRDFVILHFHATEREDTEFWRYCRHMSVPDSLARNIKMFKKCGRFPLNPGEGFGPRPWLTVMYSQGIAPQSYPHHLIRLEDDAMRSELAKVRAGIRQTVESMPRHEDFIARNCPATPPGV